MRKFIIIVAAAIAAAVVITACGSGEAASKPQDFTLRCNGTPSKVIVYLHSWGATKEEMLNFPAIADASDACVVSPDFGDFTAGSIYGTPAAIAKIDAAIDYASQMAGSSDIRLIAVDAGTAPASTYMDQHHGKVRTASLWFPVFDLQFLYEGTSSQAWQADIRTLIGHAPVGTRDPDYLARSPSRQMGMIPDHLDINVGALDTVDDVTQAGALIIHSADHTIYTWPIGHVFGPDQAAAAMRQIGQ
jgi:hypothetical protein